MSIRWTLVAVAVYAVAFGGCSSGGDLGKECVLVRKDPTDTDPSDGIRSIEIRESEVVADKDFISFGATECEDLVCVRAANTPFTRDDSNPNPVAKGMCSRPCVHTNESSCATGNDADRFTCRAMLLDTETLAAIKQQDPAKYKKYFGDTQSPYFCANPAQTQ
jgi:hypothetical protein